MPVAARLAIYYFAHFAYAGAFMAYFPLYLAERGLDAGRIAVVLALPQMARVFAPGLWGLVADRWRAQRAVVVLSCSALAAGLALLPVAHGFAGIAALIALMSVLSAGAMPLVEAITLASLAGQSGRYGPIRLWGSFGFIGAVLGAGAWLDAAAVRLLPAVLLGLALVALAAALALPGASTHAPAPADEGDRGRFANGSVRALLAAGFCMAVAHGALYAFFSLQLEHLGYSGKAIGALWTLGVLAEIGVFLYLPAIFRRFALSTILQASLLAAVLRFLAIAWAAEHVAVLILAQLLHAATFGAFHSASVAAVYRLFPRSAQARGQALFSSLSYGAGSAVGTLLAGWAWGWYGAPAAFSLSAAAALAGAYLAHKLKRARI
ncbi:MAG TPA: MFS transporter [Burkholderiales bacterium]|nr:MFS transporter [Burkholderiales bacterium]